MEIHSIYILIIICIAILLSLYVQLYGSSNYEYFDETSPSIRINKPSVQRIYGTSSLDAVIPDASQSQSSIIDGGSSSLSPVAAPIIPISSVTAPSSLLQLDSTQSRMDFINNSNSDSKNNSFQLAPSFSSSQIQSPLIASTPSFYSKAVDFFAPEP